MKSQLLFRTFNLLWWLFSDADKRHAKWLFFILIAKGFSEAIGVASVLPFLASLSNPNFTSENELAMYMYETLGFATHLDFIYASGIALVIILLMTAVVRTTAVYFLNQFIGMSNFSFSRRLLQSYLGKDYVYFLNVNTADLSTKALVETDRIVSLSLRPILELINHGVTILFLATLLLFMDPFVSTISFIVLAVSYALIYLLIRPYLGRSSSELFENNTKRFRVAQEAMRGIKHTLLSGLQFEYLKRYSEPASKVAHLNATNATLRQTPKFALEFIVFGGVVISALILIRLYGGLDSQAFQAIIPTLGVFAFAGYRLMPAVQVVYNSATTLKLGIVPLEKLSDDIISVSNGTSDVSERLDRLALQDHIKFDNVSYTYPEAAQASLSDVSVEIKAGEKIGIVGKSGAGKSTLADLLLGLLEPSAGHLIVDGQSIVANNIASWRKSIGYVPQNIFLTDSTIAENIAPGLKREDIDQDKLKAACKLARIDEFIETELTLRYDTEVGEAGIRLSGGQIQRIGIARALYNDPPLIVFDEATSAIDNQTEQDLIQQIESLPRTKTIIMIAHRLTTVENCDRIIALADGKISAIGTYDELSKTNALFGQAKLARE